MKIKSIYLILLAVLLIALCVVLYSSFSNVAATTSSDTVQTEKPTVIIDAGHGGEDGGAEAGSVLEKDINLSIAQKLSDILRLCGCETEMIRDTDTAVYEDGAESLRQKKVSDLKHRVAITNSSENNLLVSIHQNKFENSAYCGTQVFYSVNDDRSVKLAAAIQTSVVSLIQPDNTRELKPAGSDIYLLDHASVPAVIVECGFLSNDQERQKLMDESYQSEMAYSIAMGVLEYMYSEQ